MTFDIIHKMADHMAEIRNQEVKDAQAHRICVALVAALKARR